MGPIEISIIVLAVVIVVGVLAFQIYKKIKYKNAPQKMCGGCSCCTCADCPHSHQEQSKTKKIKAVKSIK